MDAETVVEVYVRDRASKWSPVHPSLAGFARVALKAGEKCDITVKLNPNAFTVVNAAGERIRDGKVFDIYAGLSQPDARSVELMGQAPLHAEMTVE